MAYSTLSTASEVAISEGESLGGVHLRELVRLNRTSSSHYLHPLQRRLYNAHDLAYIPKLLDHPQSLPAGHPEARTTRQRNLGGFFSAPLHH